MKNKKTISTIALIIMALIWGLSYVGVSDALNNGWGPFPIIFIRSIIAAIVIVPFTIKKDWKNKKIYFHGMLLGLASFLGYAFQTYGQNMTSIGETSFITSLYVVLIPIILRIVIKRKEPWFIFVSCGIAVLGCFLLNIKIPFSFDKEHLLGNGIVLAGALFFAFQIMLIGKFTHEGDDPLQLSVVNLVTMGFLALIMLSVIGDFSFHVKGLPSVIWVGLLSSGLCTVFQMVGEKHLPTTISGIIMSLESVFGAVFAFLLLHETLTWIQVVGCILIIIPVIIVQLPHKRKEDKKEEIKEVEEKPIPIEKEFEN